MDDDVVEACHPAMIEKASALTRHDESQTDKARSIYHWVRDHIPHSGDIKARAVTCSATEVLDLGTGTCFSKCHLLVALLRAAGIPSGFCYQVLMQDPPDDTTLVLHGLTAIHLAEHGAWALVDARGNTGGLNAQFSIHTPQLAFPMDPSAGEYVMETIYVSPLPQVIEQLKKIGISDDFNPIRMDIL